MKRKNKRKVILMAEILNHNSIVIDTNVLIHFFTHDFKYFEVSMKILNAIDEQKLILVVDHYGVIIDEYRKNFRKYAKDPCHSSFISQWYLRNKAKFEYVEPIEKKIFEPIIKDGFHCDDLIFIQVAPHSKLKIILSTDERSFLNDIYREWIYKNFKVKCQDPKEFYKNKFGIQT